MLLSATATFLVVGVSHAGGVEGCVVAKKTAWLNKQKGSPISKTGRVEAGACRRAFGCSNNKRKKTVTIQAKNGYQLLPKTVAVSKAFGTNPKKNNYVKIVSRKKGRINWVVVQEYLKSVSIEVSCHRRGSPGKAGCDVSGSVAAQQVPLLSTKKRLIIVGQCFKK